jgi:hypothetical protein
LITLYGLTCDGGGASPPEDPANTRCPLASVTTRALAILVPFLAAEPSTVTSSPTFSEFLLHPLRRRTFGLAVHVPRGEWYARAVPL